jgi:hypothetical protein
MLSTNQALMEWERVLKLLAQVKAHAAAPDSHELPTPLETLLHESAEAFSKHLASPVATWKHLLKAKVGNTCVCRRFHSLSPGRHPTDRLV